MAAIPRCGCWFRALERLGVMAVLLLGLPTAVCADPPGKRDGLILPVRAPITTHVSDAIDRAIESEMKKGRQPEVIIFDFNPDGQPVQATTAGPCIDLKNLVAKVRGLRTANGRPVLTVAYVHNEVKGFAVLPVLACNEIVMSEKAKLGDLRAGGKAALPPEVETSLATLAKQWPAPDAVLKMADPGIVLVPVQAEDGKRFFVSQQKKVDENGRPLAVVGDPELVPTDGLYDSKQAQRYGLIEDTCPNLATLVRRKGLQPHLSREVLLFDRTPVVFCIEFTGTVDAERLGWLDRSLHDAVRRDANVIVLYLDSHGGDTDQAYAAARQLRELRDKTGQPVKTIAYIPADRRLGAATYLALGCSEIVMSGKAALGDFSYLKGEDATTLDKKRIALKDFAASAGYDPKVFDPMLHPQEFKALDAAAAKESGVARYNDVETVEGAYAKYGINAQQVTVLKSDWLSAVAEFCRHPIVMAILVMIGIAGLILEFKMPGIGVPGVIAAICFVIFFWAYSFVGQYTVLAVLLFVLGLILLGLEIFVIPGFGVTGISGIILIVSSLALVTLEKLPATTGDWTELGTKLLLFGGSLVGAFIGAMTIAKFLPNIPYASRLVLLPPSDAEEETRAAAAHEAAAALLGAIGVAATTLRPAGKARFGDEYLDVIAENDYVNPGSRVQVIEIEGNRIVVKEV
jgi:membrane-bound ClpP family serine protease